MAGFTHGRVVWRELMTTDVEAAKRCYGELFGWRYETSKMPGMDYTLVYAGEKQIAGMAPQWVSREDVPAEVVEEQRRLFAVDAERDGRPADRVPMIVEGKLNKWYEAVCLLEQPFRDSDRKISDLITEKVALLGENIRVARFARMAVGESAADADGDQAA